MPQTLLLADDSVTIQRVIELTFADEAINVVAVSDGDQAIERIEADPPDIVLVDIGMPGRTGYEVAQHIKQSARLKHIPVLLLTGAFEPVDQAKATAAGCDGVLAKPFEPQLVIARVKELLARGGEGAAPAASAGESMEPPTLLPGPSGETWGPSRTEPKANLAPAEQLAHLDDYFDQLDAAFQKIGASGAAEPPKVPSAPSPVADIIDWFSGTPAPSGPGPDLPLSTTVPAPQRDREQTPDTLSPAIAQYPSEPVPEIAPKPASEPRADAFAKFASEPGADAFAKFASDPGLELESDFLSEPVPEIVPKPMPEPGADAFAKFASEPAPEPEPTFVPAPAPAPESKFVSDRRPESVPKLVTAPERKMATTAHTPEPQSPPGILPPIADAFAAILAAEQHEPMPTLGAPWSTPPPTPSNGGGAQSEDVIEEITSRVLTRLSDRVVRETVADTISSIAERLVREEIERIKSSIK